MSSTWERRELRPSTAASDVSNPKPRSPPEMLASIASGSPTYPSPTTAKSCACCTACTVTASAAGVDHPGTDRHPGRLVDQDEGAGGAVLRVGVAQQRHRGAQLDAADLVEPKLLGVLVAVQGVDV